MARKKPKGSGRRLYTDENPKDTVSIKFATPTDARKTVTKVRKLKKRRLNDIKRNNHRSTSRPTKS